jgi:hypothetical protein
MRNALKLAVVAAVLAIPSIALAAGTSNQTWAINCTREQYKPARIILSCGDAGIWLGRLKWSRWTATTAQATGAYNENTCTPTCSAGPTVSKPVDVTLSSPRTCPGHAHAAFGRATFTFLK